MSWRDFPRPVAYVSIGVFSDAFLHSAFEDWVGKERYLHLIDVGWTSTHWYMWVALWVLTLVAFAWLAYDELGQEYISVTFTNDTPNEWELARETLIDGESTCGKKIKLRTCGFHRIPTGKTREIPCRVVGRG